MIRLTRATTFVILLLLAASLFLFAPDYGVPDASDPHHPSFSHLEPIPAGKSGGWLSYFSAETDSDRLVFGEDGLVRGWDAAHGLMGRGGLAKKDQETLKAAQETHPIEKLIARGHRKWDRLLAR